MNFSGNKPAFNTAADANQIFIRAVQITIILPFVWRQFGTVVILLCPDTHCKLSSMPLSTLFYFNRPKKMKLLFIYYVSGIVRLNINYVAIVF